MVPPAILWGSFTNQPQRASVHAKFPRMDPELSKKGLNQARDLQSSLKSLWRSGLPIPDMVISSPLHRSLQTAEMSATEILTSAWNDVLTCSQNTTMRDASDKWKDRFIVVPVRQSRCGSKERISWLIMTSISPRGPM